MRQGNLRIPRVASNPEHGTFSNFILDGQPICVAIEPYKRDNAPNISCVNAGQYIAKKYHSPKYGWVWMLQDVQGRSFVEMHWGNVDRHTEACFIVGEKFEPLGDEWAVLESKKAFKQFMDMTKHYDQLLVTITENF